MRTKIVNPKINWSHPIARGLQMDWLLDEKGGKTPRDLVVGSKLTVTNNDWTHQYGDYGMRFDASGEYARITNLPPRQQFTRFLTVEVEFSRDSGGSGTNYGAICGLGQGTAFGDRIWLLENDNGNGGWGQTLQVWWNSQPGIWSIPYPAAGVKHHLVVMYDGGSTSNVPIFILNGVRQTVTNRLGASGSLRTGGSTFALGNTAEAGGAWDGNVYRCRTWNRMLSYREAMELWRDPFQIYQKRGVFARIAAAASYGQQCVETLVLVDTIPRVIARTLTDVETMVDLVIKSTSRTLSDQTSLIDTIVLSTGKVLTEALALVDTITKSISRTLTDASTLVDTLEKNAGRLLSEAITLVDSLIRSVGRFLLEVVTMVDSIIKSISRTLSEVLSLLDVLVRGIFRYLSDFFTMVDTFISELISNNFSAILTETMTLVDNIEKLFNHIISGIPTTLRHLAQIRPFGFLKRGIESGISLKDKNKPSMM